MGLTRIFDISRRSLATYQRSMNIAAHNISNAANPDYTRQRAVFSPETPERSANFIWGTGIKLDTISRVRDGLIDKQIISNNHSYSNNQRQSIILGQVEQIFSEPSERGISNLLNQFFNSWNELAVTPNSIPLRNNVIYAAENLATKVNTLNGDIDLVKSDMLEEFKQKTESLNHALKSIQDINKQIYELKFTGQPANDLLDKRDKYINDLSNLANINVHYDSENNAVISIGGIFALDGQSLNEFEVVDDEGSLNIALKNTDNLVTLSGGELFALSDLYSDKIPGYQERIDNLFTQLVSSVNSIHSTGYTIESGQRTGIDFFQGYSGGRLTISQDILSDPNAIAVSSDGNEGNADIGVQIAELNNAESINGSSFGNYYSSLISLLGNDKLSVDRVAESGQMVIEQLEYQRSSISAVSVDEEMTDIIKFQRAYDASAKLIKIADEMLQTIMELV